MATEFSILGRILGDAQEFVAASAEAAKFAEDFGATADEAGKVAAKAQQVAELAARQNEKAQLAVEVAAQRVERANIAVQASANAAADAQARQAAAAQVLADANTAAAEAAARLDAGEISEADAAAAASAAQDALVASTNAERDAALAAQRAIAAQADATLAAQRAALVQADATAAAAKATNAQAAASARAAEANTGLGGSIGVLNEKVSAAGKVSALALAGIAAESVHLASNFQSAMEKVHTQAGASQQEVDGLKNSVLALATQTGTGPEKLAEGLYHIESAGYRGKQAMDILTASTKLAAIGGSDLEATTQAMIATTASQIGGVKDMNDAAALLNNTVGIGDMRMDQLAKAMATGILPTAATAGLKFNDVAAALATLTDNATPADQVATHLRMTFTLMAAPTAAAAKALAGIGMTSTQMAMDMRGPNGLQTAIHDLQTHLGAMRTDAEKTAAMDTLAKAFGGGKTAGSIMTLIQESERLDDKYKALGTSASRAASFQDSWAATQKTFKNEMDKLKATAEALGIKLGTWLIPKLEAMAKFFADHQNLTKGIIIALGALMAISIAVWIANVVMCIYGMIAALGELDLALLANPITWIVLAIVAAIALVAVGIYELVKHWKVVTKALSEAWHATVGFIVRIWDDCWGEVKRIAESGWHFLDPIFKAIAKIINYLLIPIRLLVWVWEQEFKLVEFVVLWFWHNVLEPFGKFVYSIFRDVIGVELHVLQAVWHTVWGGISSAMSSIWGSVLKPTFHAVADAFDSVLGAALRLLKKNWDVIWNGVKDTVSTVWHAIKPIIDAIGGALGGISKAIGGGLGKLNKVLPFADGGAAPSGRAVLVGEEGPELVSFGSPAYVHTASATRGILAGGMAGGGWVGNPSSWGSGGGGQQVVYMQAPPDIVVNVDGQQLFKIMQTQALRYNRRNPSNGMARIAGI